MKPGLPRILLLALLAGCTRSNTLSGPPLYFRDVTALSGLDYRWTPPQKSPLNLRETLGNGAAFFDMDRDGNLDILLVGNPCKLFRGDGKGKFTPADFPTHTGELSGVAVGDYDHDGYPDLYLTAFAGGALLHSENGTGFTNVSARSGVTPQPWGTAATWVETAPGSGRLDLFVANYVDFSPERGARLLCDTRDGQGKIVLAACGPREYPPLPAAFFQNQGRGRFTDSSVSHQVKSQTRGRGLGVAAADFSGSGKQAIAFANDESPGDLLVSTGSSFVNQADALGLAYDSNARLHAGMGLDWGDYNNDGWLDLVVTTFRNEPNSLYQSEQGKFFKDLSYIAGLGASTEPYVAFGCRFFDFDNDGWLDLAFTNGHIQDNVQKLDANTTYQQPSQLFHNQSGRFSEISQRAGPAFTKPILGRGLATGDYDNDGAIDLLLVDSQATPLLLHNEAPKRGHWLGLALEGTKSNTAGYGAVVTVTLPGGKTIVRHCHADGSYLSSSDPRVHFGLGSASAVEKLVIRWPSGTVQTVARPLVDRYLPVREPS
jgi:hypothetical protein